MAFIDGVSMRKKILIVSQFLLLGILALYAIFSSQLYYEQIVRSTADLLAEQVSMQNTETLELSLTTAEYLSGKLSGNRVTLYTKTGEVIADSFGTVTNTASEEQEVLDTVTFGKGFSVRRDEVTGKNTVYYCALKDFNGTEGIIRVGMRLNTQGEMFGNMTPTLVWFALLAGTLCLVFTYFGTEFMIAPVKKIAKQAASNIKVQTNYAEFKPIAEILNRRNEEVGRRVRELSEEKEIVVRAQKSKDDFIANVTHEMNTPLTSIRGYSELLQNGVLNEEESKAAAEIMVKQSDRLTKLIARIINYSELDNDDLPSYEVELSSALKDALQTLAPSIAKKGIVLNSKIEEGIVVQSRQERVGELLGNLLRNSIRYNKEGGKLSVTLENTQKKARLTISDTGIGIAEENLERIFDRFFTVDKSHNGQGGGFGLGLAMVKKICKLSGWEIRVSSKLGEGTTFTVDF